METTDLIKQIRAAGLHPPQSLTLMVTDGCNLRCRHCLHACRPLPRAAMVPTAKIVPVIDGFTQLGGKRLNLTGGEFLSHPDWMGILRYCIQHDRIQEVCLQTNATLITQKHCKSLLELNTAKLTIQVSLDGANAATHDMLRGAGGYGRAMTGLHLLAEAGLGPQTQVAFTEMVHNFCELPQLLEKVDQMGLDRLISGTLLKGGRAANAATVGLPTPDQYRELIQRYAADSNFRKLCEQKATIAALEWFKNRTASTDVGCCCIKELFMDTRGCLYPCTLLLWDRYASQSAHNQPLERVLQKALGQWREIPILSRERGNRLETCIQCPGRNHCRGGCLGRALTCHGDVMTTEDRCALRKAVYAWSMDTNDNHKDGTGT
jgi:radical SAM protein with 4Fe4S-binding SPASM domain